MALLSLSMPTMAVSRQSSLTLPSMSADIYSPTVDLGRDFELLIRKCIEEHHHVHDKSVVEVVAAVEDFNQCENTPQNMLPKEPRSKEATDKSEPEVENEVGTIDCISEASPIETTATSQTVANWDKPKAALAQNTTEQDQDFPVLSKDSFVQNKYGQTTTKAKSKDHKKPRSKKWKALSADLLGFSLQPREQKPTELDDTMVRELRKFENLCQADSVSRDENKTSASVSDNNSKCLTQIESKTTPVVPIPGDLDMDFSDDFPCPFDLEDKVPVKILDFVESFRGISAKKRLRNKKKWRVNKAHKQVKDHHCYSVSNVSRGKHLWIHHRVVGRMVLLLGVSYTPGLSIRRIDKSKGLSGMKRASNPSMPASRSTSSPIKVYATLRPKPAQALTAYNADGDLTADLVNLLITLQDRDLTPEDYEILLRLDERVAAKTVESDILKSLKTDKATSENAGESCSVCMEEYTVGQDRTHLPCGHVFHGPCIDTWLTKNSQNCPLDGLPVASS